MKRLLTILSLALTTVAMAQQNVSVTLNGLETKMSNGLVNITIGSNGRISNMQYKGGKNVIGSSGVYFDFTSKQLGNKALSPAKAEVVRQTDDYAEVVYSNTSYAPHFQQGFIMRKGVSGVYMYVVANGSPNSDTLQVQEVRVCTRLASDFLNGYVDDTMQGRLPSNDVMASLESGGTSNANYVQDATYRLPDGTVYTKYNWAQYCMQDSLHGLMNANTGVWNIPCSREWIPGGPMKQELTVHATGKSPITIQMLQGEHFGTPSIYYNENKKKIYGPFFLYLNSGTQEEMIADAKREAHEQEQAWPFDWFSNELYPLDRATVTGQIAVATGQTAEGLQVVLGLPGKKLYEQNDGYLFYAKTDADGRFTIPNVRKGAYTLYAFATNGDNTDELQVADINVASSRLDLGTLKWTPTKYQTQLWLIGDNDRTAKGFKGSDQLRAYGHWNNTPATLSYTIGQSTPENDWYYAQTKNGTWTINFNLDQTYEGTAHFTASLAAITRKPKIAVKVNGTSITTWSLSTNDGAIYRSAILGGWHQVQTISFPASRLKQGANTLQLTMSGAGSGGGVIWDCLKLEVGDAVVNGISSIVYDGSNGSAPTGDVLYVYTLGGRTVAAIKGGETQSVDLPKGCYVWRKGCLSGKFVK